MLRIGDGPSPPRRAPVATNVVPMSESRRHSWAWLLLLALPSACGTASSQGWGDDDASSGGDQGAGSSGSSSGGGMDGGSSGSSSGGSSSSSGSGSSSGGGSGNS